MTSHELHRLNGLEPDNLLAFMALLGLLRSLEESRPDWHPRVAWTVEDPPLRPLLRVPATVDRDVIVDAAAEGLNALAPSHDFRDKDLQFPPDNATRYLQEVADVEDRNRYTAKLWAALTSDAAATRDGKKISPTPLCLMFGQGHQYFLSRLSSVPRQSNPPPQGSGRKKREISEADCLRETLFSEWARGDRTDSFRWDPKEDVRYAYRARNPTDATTKEATQHGANRLAAVGLSEFTVVPVRRSLEVSLAVHGGCRLPDGAFAVGWPIWREPASLAGIRAMLGHPRLNRSETRATFGIVEYRQTRRISVGKYMNFTRAAAVIDS